MVCAVTVPVYTDLSQSQTEHISTFLLQVVSVHILHNMLRWVHRHMDECTEIKCSGLPVMLFREFPKIIFTYYAHKLVVKVHTRVIKVKGWL